MDIRPSYSEELMVKILRKSSLVSLIKVEICQCVVKGCQVIAAVRRPFVVSLMFPRGVLWMYSAFGNRGPRGPGQRRCPQPVVPGGGQPRQFPTCLAHHMHAASSPGPDVQTAGDLIEAFEGRHLFPYHQKVSNYNPHVHHF